MSCPGTNVDFGILLYDNNFPGYYSNAAHWRPLSNVYVRKNGAWVESEVYIYKYGGWRRVWPTSSGVIPAVSHPEWVIAGKDITGATMFYLVNISSNSWTPFYYNPSNFIAGSSVKTVNWEAGIDTANYSQGAVNAIISAGATSVGGLPVGGRIVIYTDVSTPNPEGGVCTRNPPLRYDITLGPTKFQTVWPVYSREVPDYTGYNRYGVIVAGVGGSCWLLDNLYSRDWDPEYLTPQWRPQYYDWSPTPIPPYDHYYINANFHDINGTITNGNYDLNRIKYAHQGGINTLGMGVHVCEDGYVLDGSTYAAFPNGNYDPYQGFPNLTVAQQRAAYPWPGTGTAPYGMLGSPQLAKGVQGADTSMVGSSLGPYGSKWFRELKISGTALNSVALFSPDMTSAVVTVVENLWAYQGAGFGDPNLPLVLKRRNNHMKCDMIAVGDNGKIMLRVSEGTYNFSSPGDGAITLADAGQVTITDQSPGVPHVGLHTYGDMFKNPWVEYKGFLENDNNGNPVFREWTETADFRCVLTRATGTLYASHITIIVGDGGVIYYMLHNAANTINGESYGSRFFRAIAVTVANLNSVVWKGDRYIATGDMGTVLESPDGITWSNVTQSGKPASYAWGPVDSWDPGT